MFALKTRAPWVMVKTHYLALIESAGWIVVFASSSGFTTHPGQAAYSLAKAAVTSMVRTEAQEWAEDGIRVAANMIQTPMNARF